MTGALADKPRERLEALAQHVVVVEVVGVSGDAQATGKKIERALVILGHDDKRSRGREDRSRGCA